jgi:hypothetical protein
LTPRRRIAGSRLGLTTAGALHVPRYEVTVQGHGIAVPIDSAVAVGFLRLVQVRARDPLEAEVRAVARVQSEWEASVYAFKNRSAMPQLTITRIGSLSWWHRLLGAPAGYLFFGADGVQLSAGSG